MLFRSKPAKEPPKKQVKSEQNDNQAPNADAPESKEVQDIKQMGVPNMPQNSTKEIQCLTIIGEIEGHFAGNPQKKSTKYEHIIPMLYSIEESNDIKGVLVILNTVGGDVEASPCYLFMLPAMLRVVSGLFVDVLLFNI